MNKKGMNVSHIKYNKHETQLITSQYYHLMRLHVGQETLNMYYVYTCVDPNLEVSHRKSDIPVVQETKELPVSSSDYPHTLPSEDTPVSVPPDHQLKEVVSNPRAQIVAVAGVRVAARPLSLLLTTAILWTTKRGVCNKTYKTHKQVYFNHGTGYYNCTLPM